MRKLREAFRRWEVRRLARRIYVARVGNASVVSRLVANTVSDAYNAAEMFIDREGDAAALARTLRKYK